MHDNVGSSTDATTGLMRPRFAHKTKIAHIPLKAASIGEEAAKPVGVALDMGNGGRDDDDSEFERF